MSIARWSHPRWRYCEDYRRFYSGETFRAHAIMHDRRSCKTRVHDSAKISEILPDQSSCGRHPFQLDEALSMAKEIAEA